MNDSWANSTAAAATATAAAVMDLSSPYLLAAAFFLQSATCPVLSLLCWIIHQRVQVAHPIYALIYQDVIYMLASNALCILSFPAFLAAGISDLYVEFNAFLMVGSMHFHQVSWLVVTALRFYLLLKGDQVQQQDLSDLSRPCLLVVWASYALFALLFYSARTVAFLSLGLDTTEMLPLPPDPWLRAFLYSMALALGNIPDFASIAIYATLYCRTASQQGNQVSDFQLEEQQQDDSSYFEGIYVGNNNPVIPEEEEQEQHNIPGQIPETCSRHSDAQAASAPDLVPVNHAASQPLPLAQDVVAPLPPPPQPPPHQSDEADCAVKALRLHALTCLLDILLFPLLVATGTPPFVLPYTLAMANVYWIPTACTLRNFGKLRSVVKEVICDLVGE